MKMSDGEEGEAPDALYENERRPERMVSLQDGQITVRMATFLKPTARNQQQAVPIPNNTPLLHQTLPCNHHRWPNSKVSFRCWKPPQKNWKLWFDRFAPKYKPTWIQAGIYDALLSSTLKLRCNRQLVLGLSEHWCPETNTFVFQWGEATVTLEDVMVLGGYPVLGESVTGRSQTEELKAIEAALRKYRIEFQQCRAKKASHGEWIKFFMEKETEYEHAAFLSLWLSRFLFPSVSQMSEIIVKDVFPIAAKLSLGIRVALAPAVLASLYMDLRKLTREAMASSKNIILIAPFRLLQMWAFERFPILAPKCPNSIQPGEPRMARWHKQYLKVTMPEVNSALELAKNFEWRPYIANVENWKHPSYYEEMGRLVSNYSRIKEDDGLLSFFRIVWATELVGLNCRENYSPHRVAMQFGMDQDLPGEFNELNVRSEVANFYIPSCTFQPGVTERYSSWWKDSLVVRENALKHVLLKKRNSQNCMYQKDGDTEDCSVGSRIDRGSHKALYLSDDLESCTQQPDAEAGPSQLKNSTIVSIRSNVEDSDQPISLSSIEDSDDDHLPISTCLRKSAGPSQSKNSTKASTVSKFKDGNQPTSCSEDSCDDHLPISTWLRKLSHPASTVASKTSNVSKRKFPSSHKEQNSQKKTIFREEVLSGKEDVEVLEPLTKPLDINTDNQPMNGCERQNEEDETSTHIKGNEAYVIDIPDEFQMEARISRLERIVARLKAVKAARALEIRASSIHRNEGFIRVRSKVL